MILVGETYRHLSTGKLVQITEANECYLMIASTIDGKIVNATWIKQNFLHAFGKVTQLTLALT
jgi:hypothetical protein